MANVIPIQDETGERFARSLNSQGLGAMTLTRKEVAERLGVIVSWLEDNTRIGPPYYALTPRTIRYDEAELMAWLKQRKGQ